MGKMNFKAHKLTDNSPLPMMGRDMGNGWNAMSVCVEGIPSEDIVVSTLQNTSLSTLITNVNSYLSSSGKRCQDITFFAPTILTTLTYIAIITEVKV